MSEITITAPDQDWRTQTPLGKITCSSSDCDKDLHCFRRRAPRDDSYRNGVCSNCGKNLIDWTRLDKHNLKDVNYTFKALKYELVRHYYWHREIDGESISKARKLGINGLQLWASNRLEKYINKPSDQNPWDGRQTPKSGNVVFYAQHATASCCRKCMEEWHGIDRNRELTKSEISYFTELIMDYIKDQLPNLPLVGKQIPQFRKSGTRKTKK